MSFRRLLNGHGPADGRDRRITIVAYATMFVIRTRKVDRICQKKKKSTTTSVWSATREPIAYVNAVRPRRSVSFVLRICKSGVLTLHGKRSPTLIDNNDPVRYDSVRPADVSIGKIRRFNGTATNWFRGWLWVPPCGRDETRVNGNGRVFPWKGRRDKSRDDRPDDTRACCTGRNGETSVDPDRLLRREKIFEPVVWVV